VQAGKPSEVQQEQEKEEEQGGELG